MAPRKLQVDAAAAGLTVERWLSRAVPGISLERARALLAEQRVRICGKVARAGRKLWGDEEVELELPAPARIAADMGGPALPVLFESPQALVVDKPAGVVVEPDGHNPSVVELLAAQRAGFDVEGQAAPGIVHRLDRDTTGCVVVARTDEGAAALRAAFEAGQVDKEYLALVLGAPAAEARLEGPYGRSKEDPRRYTTQVKSARRAALRYACVERLASGSAALLRVFLETGRTHQIRVQLAEAGLPLLGDPLYGTREAREHPAARAAGRILLHAERLALRGGFDCRARVPADFEGALDRLR